MLEFEQGDQRVENGGRAGDPGLSAGSAERRPVCVRAEGASYRIRGYRSFEFVDCEVRSGTVHAILSVRGADARDFLLAAAGLVRPTQGTVEVGPGEFRSALRARGAVRCGFFPGLNGIEGSATVEEALTSEFGLLGRACSTADVLALAQAFMLATYADTAVGSLEPAAYLRLGVALACIGEPVAVVVDATAAACSPAEEGRLLSAMRAFARAHGTAFAVATVSPSFALAADARTPIDCDAAELLARFEGDQTYA